MTRQSRIRLAEVLIAFSFVLIITGIGLNLDNHSLIDPVTNTHVVETTNTEGINITTTDDVSIDDIKDSPEVTEPESTTEPTNESTNTTTGIPSNGTTSTTPSTQQPSQIYTNTPTIEETNNNLRNNIQNTYGITVKYGAETNGYSIGGLSTIMLSDANRINEVLSTLNYNLSLYPADFINETKQGGYSLTIYLLKRYSQENVTGITDSTTKNVVISLATDYSFAESLHHELYHYVEKYMYTRGANYTTWNTLNPSGFSYGSINDSLSYTTGNNAYAPFVNSYAQTDEYEDRASTFEYMMATSEASCLTTGTTIWKKAKYMCEQIDAVFQTVSPSKMEYWERYVYN